MKTIIIKLSLHELLSSQTNEVVIHLGDNSSNSISLKQDLTYTVQDDVTSTVALESDASLFAFMKKTIAQLKQNGQVRSSETYSTTLNSISLFREGKDIPFQKIDAQLMTDYEQWLHRRGVKPNSSSFYMRILRAVYKRAVVSKLTADRQPFAHVYTGIARTNKRAVDIGVIRQLEHIELEDPKSRFARDMFMFSFYTQGMSFVDMAYLKKGDICNDVLVYHRRKTGQQIRISWLPHMQQIVDRNPTSDGNYLLPIIHSSWGNARSSLRYCQFQVNKALSALGRQIGLEHSLTMYVARHSWATIAHSINVPMEVISQGMGHNNEQTTRIYLKEIDNGRLAAANRQIFDLVLSAPSSNG